MQMKTLWVVGFVLALVAPLRGGSARRAEGSGPGGSRDSRRQSGALQRARRGRGRSCGAYRQDGWHDHAGADLGADIPKVRVDVQVTPPQQANAVTFQLAADGARISLAEHGSRIYLQRDLASGASLLSNVSVLLIREFGLEQPFAREANATSLTYVGSETVEGVECDVIHAVLNPGGDEVRWYFGKTDHLPRRVQARVPARRARRRLPPRSPAWRRCRALGKSSFGSKNPRAFGT